MIESYVSEWLGPQLGAVYQAYNTVWAFCAVVIGNFVMLRWLLRQLRPRKLEDIERAESR